MYQNLIAVPVRIGSLRVIMNADVVSTIEATKSDEEHVRQTKGNRRKLNRQETPAGDVVGASETLAGCECRLGPSCAYDSMKYVTTSADV